MLNSKDVGERASVSETTILVWLKRLKIPTRERGSLALHVALTEETMGIINGFLLGDWSVTFNKKKAAFLQTGSKYKEFLDISSNRLSVFGIQSLSMGIRCYNTHFVKDGKKYGPYTSYFYMSRAYRELLDVYKLWYPSGNKVVPRNLTLTPATITEWFIGDGCLECRKHGRPRIGIATHGFLARDVDFLVSLLAGIGICSYRTPRNAIRINTDATEDFLDYIGPCPPEIYNIYGYKFDLSRRGTIEEWRKEHNAYPSDTLPVPLGERAMEATYNGRAAPCP